MARFSFCAGGTYQSEAVNADAQRCINFYPEPIESGVGASAMALYPTPGLNPFAQPPAGNQVRCLYQFNGRLFTITDELYEVLSNGTVNDLGLSAPPDDGQPATMEANSAGQLLVCGGGQMSLQPLNPFMEGTIATIAYVQGSLRGHFGDRIVITLTAAAPFFPIASTVYFDGLTAVPSLNGLSTVVIAISGNIVLLNPPNGWFNPYIPIAIPETGTVGSTVQGIVGQQLPPISMIGFIDDYFLALAANSPVFYNSGLNDGANWDPTFVYQVSEYSDNVLSMFVNYRQLWLFGGKKTVVYYDSGDPLTPFQPIDGAFIEQGIAAPWSVARLDNSVFWLSNDERGKGIVFRANGYSPVRVSNHCVEREWNQYSTIRDARAYSFMYRGHPMYHLWFPTADKSWRYDASTGMWHEVAFLHNDGTLHAHRSSCHTEAFGQHIVGDSQSPRLYSMDGQYLTDNVVPISGTSQASNPIRRVRRAPHISNELEWAFHHKLRVNLETGLGPQPPLTGFPEGVSDLILHDANGNNWLVTIEDNGVPSSVNLGPGLGQLPYIFVDMGFYPYQITCYTLSIDAAGNLFLIPPSPPPVLPILTGFQKRLFMITPGSLQTDLSVVNGNLIIEPPATAIREPQIMLRYSDDGGHTWSNEYMLGCGMSGDFRKRVEWRNLGRTRDRIYELSATDPVPWRIVDAYLTATPGYQPTERYAAQLGKMA